MRFQLIMPNPTQQALRYSAVQDILNVLPDHGRLLIAADKDGTLDPKIPNPEQAFVPPTTVEQLLRLASQTDVKLLLVSGREIEWLEKLAGPIAYNPNVTLYGSHGNEKKIGGSSRLEYGPGTEFSEALIAANQKLITALQGQGMTLKREPSESCGLFIEMKLKAAGLVLHFRSAPELAQKAQPMFQQAVQELIMRGSHVLEVGDGIFELKLKGRDKGSVITQELLSYSDAAVLVLGDDTTDIGMMRNALENSRNAVVVMVGDKQVDSNMSRDGRFFRLENPTQVQSLLRGLADKRNCSSAPDLNSLATNEYYRMAFNSNS